MVTQITYKNNFKKPLKRVKPNLNTNLEEFKMCQNLKNCSPYVNLGRVTNSSIKKISLAIVFNRIGSLNVYTKITAVTYLREDIYFLQD